MSTQPCFLPVFQSHTTFMHVRVTVYYFVSLHRSVERSPCQSDLERSEHCEDDRDPEIGTTDVSIKQEYPLAQ